MNTFQLRRSYRSAQRLRQIVNICIRHGFGQLVEQLGLQKYIPFRKRVKGLTHWDTDRDITGPERLRKVFEDLGPSFIKLAQLLSSRPDLISESYANELKRLQDEVPPFAPEVARSIIENEIKLPLTTAFRDFDDDPIAAASIAQVHQAVLSDGTRVVVKVQRPQIRDVIETDIRIFRVIARLMSRYIPEANFFNPEGIVEEFARTVRKETDFTDEGRNACRFRRIFAETPEVMIPRIYPEFMTRNVLVMDRIDGVNIDDVSGIDRFGLNRQEVALNGVGAYFKQIFEHGFFHADPHPGNIFVTAEGQIAFCDFGQVGRVTETLREHIANLFMALLSKDFDRIVSEYIEMGIVSQDIDMDQFRSEFRTDLADFVEPLYGLTLKEINFAAYLNALTEIAARHRLRLPSELLLVNKAMMVLESIYSELDPNFDFFKAAEPYASKLMRTRLDPGKAFERARKNVVDLGDFTVTFPRQLRMLAQKMIKDNFHIKMHHVGLERLIRDFDRSSNRIAFSLIVAALLLSSAIMHASAIGPRVYGISLLGLSSFLFALILGIWLLISIIRSGRL